MRPSFTSAFAPVWRGNDRIQIGDASLVGVDENDIRTLRGLDGSLPQEIVAASNARLGFMTSLLRLIGAVEDGPSLPRTPPPIRVEGAGLIAEAARGLLGQSHAAPNDAASVLLCCDGSGEPMRQRGEMLAGLTVRHLPAYLVGHTIVVGPLVDVSRGTSCLRCQHLARCDRDPTWPVVAAQLALPPPRAVDEPELADRVLAVVAAALAIEQLLAAPGMASTTEGSLEWTDGVVRRRSWPRHPECPMHSVRAARV